MERFVGACSGEGVLGGNATSSMDRVAALLSSLLPSHSFQVVHVVVGQLQAL